MDKSLLSPLFWLIHGVHNWNDKKILTCSQMTSSRKELHRKLTNKKLKIESRWTWTSDKQNSNPRRQPERSGIIDALNVFQALLFTHFGCLVCVCFRSHLMRSWDNWVSSRTQVLRDFNMMCSLPTAHRTPNSWWNFATTCATSGSRRGRMMMSFRGNQSTCRSVQRCVAVVVVCCSCHSHSSTAISSTTSWMTPSTVSVVSASSSVCLFTTNLTPTYDPTSSITCAASTTILSAFGTILSLLSKVSYISIDTRWYDERILTFV